MTEDKKTSEIIDDIKTMRWLNNLYHSKGPDALAGTEHKMRDELNERFNRCLDLQGIILDQYDALAKENEELKAKTTQMSDVIEEYVKQITSLRESLKLAVECLETAEAEIAVYSVTAYGHYQHDLPSLVMIRKAQATIKAKGEL